MVKLWVACTSSRKCQHWIWCHSFKKNSYDKLGGRGRKQKTDCVNTVHVCVWDRAGSGLIRDDATQEGRWWKVTKANEHSKLLS